MIDLLKNENNKDVKSEKEFKHPGGKDNTSEENQKIDINPQEADIKRYKDPEGLTMGKLKVGLWLIENRKNLLFVLYGILIIVSVLTWPLFFYTFGSYVIKGMNDDELLISQMVNQKTLTHEMVMAQAPQDLIYQSVQSLKLSDGKYDFLVQIKNPNDRYWGRINYSFVAGDEKIGEFQGFVLPGESKYLLALGQEVGSNPAGVKLYVDSVNWQHVNLHKYPDWNQFRDDRMKFSFSDISFTPAQTTILTEKLDLNTLDFVVSNDSAFNYWNVDLIIFLYKGNNIIGVNKYSLGEFMSGETRNIQSTWPGELLRVDDVVVVPEIDITKDDIYIKFDVGSGEEK